MAADEGGGRCRRRLGKAAGPTAVTVSRPVRREVTPFEDFTGRVDLDTDIPVSVRVSGSLQQVAKDRVEVKKGDVLFQIDPAPFKEVLAKAEANRDAAAEPERAAAEAAVMRARRDLDASPNRCAGRRVFPVRLARVLLAAWNGAAQGNGKNIQRRRPHFWPVGSAARRSLVEAIPCERRRVRHGRANLPALPTFTGGRSGARTGRLALWWACRRRRVSLTKE